MKQNYILYAGSYAASEEAGIHGYRLIRGEGGEPRLTEVFAAAGVSNPSYLAVSSDGRFLYSVMEDMRRATPAVWIRKPLAPLRAAWKRPVP